MKAFIHLAILSLLIVPASPGQEESLPPLPGVITSGSISAQIQSSPGAAIAQNADEVPDEPAENAPTKAHPAPVAGDPASTLAVADPGGSADNPATPPGTPSSPGAAPEKGLDYLQRSNLILTMILENERAVDPFGLVMDPANAKSTPVLAEQYKEEEEPTVLNSSSLKSALMSLPITGVYPKKEVVVIGARAFPVGGQFGMKLQELTIRLRFEGIRGGEIYFKDMETREITSVPFNVRPAEFEPLNKESKPETGAGISSMGELFIAN